MLTIKQLKTKSYLNDDGDKCWTITTPEGEEFDCQPQGQKYLCCGLKGTLKTIKEAIVSGEIGISDDELFSDEVEDDEEGRPTDQFRDLWECVPLGALLIEHLGVDACEADLKIMETLDAAGWLLKDGDLMESDTPIDLEKVRRAFKRYDPPREKCDVEDSSEIDADEMGTEEVEEVLPVPEVDPDG